MKTKSPEPIHVPALCPQGLPVPARCCASKILRPVQIYMTGSEYMQAAGYCGQLGQ